MSCRLFITTILAVALKRQPTDEERVAALKAASDYAGGEYLYVGNGSRIVTDHMRALILNARIAGKTYRQISTELRVARKTIAAVVSNSP